MSSKKKTFYRTVLQVEVLSEEPFQVGSLEDVAEAISVGGCSGQVKTVLRNEKLTGRQAAAALQRQCSDPEFFQLDGNGNDTGFQEEAAQLLGDTRER